MTRFSFVHASDLHLDSPFAGVTATAPEVAERLRTATFDAFDNIVRLCIERRVDFLLVAGDVYDGADRSLRAQLRFRDGLQRLAEHGIRAFVVHGNHDALEGWSSAIEWPVGVRVFGEEVATVAVERDGAPIALVSGISYPRRQESRNLARLFGGGNDAGGPFHIGLLHANAGANTQHDPYAPCDLADLLGRGIDYWALGHIHARQTMHEHPHVVYPGNPQGRHMRETGERGCVVVRVHGRVAEVEFAAVDAVRWQEVELDIGGLETIDALDTALDANLFAAVSSTGDRPLICRVRLGGRGPLHRELRRDDAPAQFLERLRERWSEARPFVWIEAVDVACQPEIDLAQRREGQDLAAELLRAADGWRAGDLRESLWRAVAPLYDDPRLRQVLRAPDLEELERLLAEAEMICLDRLEGE
jgi:hypothetical protein